MQLLEIVDSAVTVAAVIADRIPETLSDTAKRLYTALIATAVETGKGRGYAPSTAFVTFYLPLEVLADVCGMHRVTAWRNLKPLRELGVLDYRPQKGTLRRIGTVNTGTLFCVRLNPSAGTRARLSYDDMKHKWRDLQKDVLSKRTAYRTLKDRVQQSVKDSLDISRLIYWTLPLTPKSNQTPLKSLSDSCTRRQASLEAVLDVKSAAKEDRNQMVQLASEALAASLNDAKSTGWYQKLLWQILRRFDATGEDYSYQVYLAAQRARADTLEGFARRPGALFTSRVKQAPWFDEVMRQPLVRVGTKPN